MHIAEGLLPLAHAAAWFAASAPFVVAGALRTRALYGPDGRSEERALLGMAGALAFAVTVFPVPVPGLGITSHLCATPVLSLLLGPRLLVLPTVGLLLLQALFLAHGGLTTLGANVFTLGVCGPLLATALARALARAGAPRGVVVGAACALASFGVYVVDAAVLALALPGRPFAEWLRVVLVALTPAQAPLSLLEGVVSALLVRALADRRPDLLPAWLARTAPLPTPAAPPALVAVVLAVAAGLPAARAQDEGLRGLDEAVFERAAAEGGRASRPSGFIEEGGEAFLMAVAASFFAAGVVVGRGWTRLTAAAPGGGAPGGGAPGGGAPGGGAPGGGAPGGGGRGA